MPGDWRRSRSHRRGRRGGVAEGSQKLGCRVRSHVGSSDGTSRGGTNRSDDRRPKGHAEDGWRGERGTPRVGGERCSDHGRHRARSRDRSRVRSHDRGRGRSDARNRSRSQDRRGDRSHNRSFDGALRGGNDSAESQAQAKLDEAATRASAAVRHCGPSDTPAQEAEACSGARAAGTHGRVATAPSSVASADDGQRHSVVIKAGALAARGTGSCRSSSSGETSEHESHREGAPTASSVAKARNAVVDVQSVESRSAATRALAAAACDEVSVSDSSPKVGEAAKETSRPTAPVASNVGGGSTGITGAILAAKPATLKVEGCSHRMISEIVHGTYHRISENHGKPVYRKTQQFNGLDVLIHYWDSRDGIDQQGWWFAPRIGGDEVWAHTPDGLGPLPPCIDWHVPHDGPIDKGMRVLAFDAPRLRENGSTTGTGSSAEKCTTGSPAEQRPLGQDDSAASGARRPRVVLRPQSNSDVDAGFKVQASGSAESVAPQLATAKGSPPTESESFVTLFQKRQQERQVVEKKAEEERRQREEATARTRHAQEDVKKKKQQEMKRERAEERRRQREEKRRRREEAKQKRREEKREKKKEREVKRQQEEAERRRAIEEREKQRNKRLEDLQGLLDTLQKEENDYLQQLEELRQREAELRRKESSSRQRQEEVRREMLDLAKASASDMEALATEAAAVAAAAAEAQADLSASDSSVDGAEIEDEMSVEEEDIEDTANVNAREEPRVEESLGEGKAAAGDEEKRRENEACVNTSESKPTKGHDTTTGSPDGFSVASGNHAERLHGDSGASDAHRHARSEEGALEGEEKAPTPNCEADGGKESRQYDRNGGRIDGGVKDQDSEAGRKDEEKAPRPNRETEMDSRGQQHDRCELPQEKDLTDKDADAPGPIREDEERENSQQRDRDDGRRGRGPRDKDVRDEREKTRRRDAGRDASEPRAEFRSRSMNGIRKSARTSRAIGSSRAGGGPLRLRARDGSRRGGDRRPSHSAEIRRRARHRDGGDDRDRRGGDERGAGGLGVASRQPEQSRGRRRGEDDDSQHARGDANRRRSADDDGHSRDETERKRRRDEANGKHDDAGVNSKKSLRLRSASRTRRGEEPKRSEVDEAPPAKEADELPRQREEASARATEAAPMPVDEAREVKQGKAPGDAIDEAEEQKRREEAWRKRKDEENELRRQKEEEMKRHEEELERKRARRREQEQAKLKEQESRLAREREDARDKAKEAEQASAGSAPTTSASGARDESSTGAVDVVPTASGARGEPSTGTVDADGQLDRQQAPSGLEQADATLAEGDMTRNAESETLPVASAEERVAGSQEDVKPPEEKEGVAPTTVESNNECKDTRVVLASAEPKIEQKLPDVPIVTKRPPETKDVPEPEPAKPEDKQEVDRPPEDTVMTRKKQREQKAVLTLLNTAQALAQSTVENYQQVKEQLDDALATELQYCGEQGKLVEAEVRRVIDLTTAYFNKLEEKKKTSDAGPVSKDHEAWDVQRELHSKFKHDKPPPLRGVAPAAVTVAGKGVPPPPPPPPPAPAATASAGMQEQAAATGAGAVSANALPPPAPPPPADDAAAAARQFAEVGWVLDTLEGRAAQIEGELQKLSSVVRMIPPAQARERAHAIATQSISLRGELPALNDRLAKATKVAPAQAKAMGEACKQRVLDLDAWLGCSTSQATCLRSMQTEGEAGERERLRVEVGFAIRNAMAERGIMGDSIFAAADVDADGFVSRQDFISMVTRCSSNFSLPQINDTFEYLDDDRSGYLGKDEFMRCIRLFYKVVVATQMMDNPHMAVGKHTRSLAVGEIIELMKGPMRDHSGSVARIGGRAMSDGRTGWALVSAQGTHFLSLTQIYLRAKVPTQLTKRFSPDTEVVKRATVGETFECVVWEKPDGSTNVWRAKVKSLDDGAVGWATTADRGNVVLALAMDVA